MTSEYLNKTSKVNYPLNDNHSFSGGKPNKTKINPYCQHTTNFGQNYVYDKALHEERTFRNGK